MYVCIHVCIHVCVYELKFVDICIGWWNARVGYDGNIPTENNITAWVNESMNE